MKTLVTGATGYVGHNLALSLAQNGNMVNILVRNTNSPLIPQHPLIRIFAGDITKKETILPAIENCDTVFHTAALVRFCSRRPTDFYDINVEGTRHMLDAALKAGVKKFVFTSTGGVIGPSLHKEMSENYPRVAGFTNDYDLSKFLAEKLVKEYADLGLHTVIVTSTKVFGPGIDKHQLSVNSVIRRFISGKISFCPRPDDFVSNYVFIDDLVKGHLLAAVRGIKGEKYIIGGENLSYKEFFEKLRQVSGMRGIIIPMPKSIAALYGGLHFIQRRLIGKDPFFNSKAVSQIYCNKSFTSAKAIDELGYSIAPFTAALQRTIHSFKIELHAKQRLYPHYRVQ
ncbi:NAD-dependent epimerase/dehydratase family protein [Terrimonas pollutisoli]|uniref:NAD-dependent epimerase/dehydratase family protein n=1 Tax=Terrimonas pollutisoli TaxID=3034147 RepID=UPI0023EDBA1C|nr:NAD-dependent epimerase/dehydratase family protein [Terrimonas sp. H1YJ31]